MRTNDAVIELVRLDAPMYMTGLSFADSGLPAAFESLGKLWERFHNGPSLPDAVSPAVEIGVSVFKKDYFVGSQTAALGQGPGLTSFTVPAGDYIKGSFSAGSFEDLVDGKLQTIWEDMARWAKDNGITISSAFSVEVYPQDTVKQERPEMYCLCPIAPDRGSIEGTDL